jgi:hypothetical protein
MKATYKGETVYIGYISENEEYALVSKTNYGEKIFKVNICDLEDLPQKSLKSKLKKFKKEKGS